MPTPEERLREGKGEDTMTKTQNKWFRAACAHHVFATYPSVFFPEASTMSEADDADSNQLWRESIATENFDNHWNQSFLAAQLGCEKAGLA